MMRGNRRNREKALNWEEVQAILAAADRRLSETDPIRRRPGIYAWIALTTGLRIGETAQICGENFDWSDQTVEVWRLKSHGKDWKRGVPKSGAVRDVVFLPERLVARLGPLLPKEGPIFQRGPTAGNRGNGFVAVRTLWDDWAALLREADVDHRRPHASRHTYATLMAPLLDNVLALQTALGHSDFQTSQIYTKGVKHERAIRVAANKLFGGNGKSKPEPRDDMASLCQKVAGMEKMLQTLLNQAAFPVDAGAQIVQVAR